MAPPTTIAGVPPASLVVAEPEAESSPRVSQASLRGRAVRVRVMGLALGDVVAVVLATICAQSVTGGVSGVLLLPEAALLTAIWLLAARATGLNARRAAHRESTADELRLIIATTAIALFVDAGVLDLVGQRGDVWLHELISALLVIALVVTARATARALVARTDAGRIRTILVGDGESNAIVARRAHAASSGINVLGVVNGVSVGTGVPHLGTLDDLEQIVSTLGADRVVVAIGSDARLATWDAIARIFHSGVRIDVASPTRASVDGVVSIAGVQFGHIAAHSIPPLGRLLKRGLDLVGSALLLLVLSPLLLAVAIAIRLESPGPALFRQRRVGAGSRAFTIVKFRSMRVGAHAERAGLHASNGHATGDDRMFKMAADPRVTRLGAVIRRTSIDELPQLWNVLRGDMSLVGPRPLIPEEDRHVAAEERGRRLLLKPGLTGPWQILGRADIPFGEMVELDCNYVAGWTPLRDVGLLMRTIPVVFGRRGAY